MYDIIGDIHGFATALEKLLHKLGYTEHNGLWQHPHRKVIFLGDFVDRGPQQIDTVQIARAMVEGDRALAVMGNHEFNAVAWATEDPKQAGEYLRPHSDRNRGQHAEFLQQVGENSALHQDMLAWFKTLPLFLDLPGLRIVHACWHKPSMDVLAKFTDARQRIRDDAWVALTRKGTDAFEALEIVLKGLEVELPRGKSFPDKGGIRRTHIRTRWWHSSARPFTYRDLAMVPVEEISRIPHEPMPTDILPGYDDDKPLFVGHYWLNDEPAPLTDHIACLDYSIAALTTKAGGKGKLCAYRWDGERVLTRDRFIWVEG